jgi:pimeloyl-ACP methyl ester carboxylesterase
MMGTLRFVRQYARPTAGAVMATDTTYSRGGEVLPATVFRPAGRARPLPAWVVLHGLTRTGRAHPSLIRFASAVASAGNLVFVPDIPEWRALRVAPAITVSTIAAAVAALQRRSDVQHDRVGIFGFSFGATQALVAASQPDTAALLAGIAAWGGYCDLQRLFRFGLTGAHELDGTTWQTQPDPYGPWIMAGNYLTRVPGLEDAGPVADALLTLATEAGDRGMYAWEPVFDASKRRLREPLALRHRELFDMLAPETTQRRPDEERVLQLADTLAATVVRVDPLLEPRPFLGDVAVPVVFAHGRDDRLIPFSETLRLARHLPPDRVRSVTVTALFQHSGGTQSGLGPAGFAREGARFLRLLHRVLRLV